MVFEICISIITIFFVALVFYLIMTLRNLMTFLGETQKLVVKLESELPVTNEKLQRMLENSNQLTFQLRDQLSSLNPLLGSIRTLGSAAENFIDGSEKASRAKKKNDWKQNVGDVLDLAALGANVWQRIRREQP